MDQKQLCDNIESKDFKSQITLSNSTTINLDDSIETTDDIELNLNNNIDNINVEIMQNEKKTFKSMFSVVKAFKQNKYPKKISKSQTDLTLNNYSNDEIDTNKKKWYNIINFANKNTQFNIKSSLKLNKLNKLTNLNVGLSTSLFRKRSFNVNKSSLEKDDIKISTLNICEQNNDLETKIDTLQNMNQVDQNNDISKFEYLSSNEMYNLQDNPEKNNNSLKLKNKKEKFHKPLKSLTNFESKNEFQNNLINDDIFESTDNSKDLLSKLKNEKYIKNFGMVLKKIQKFNKNELAPKCKQSKRLIIKLCL